ncbi:MULTISPECIES: YkgJ family cysteine cluster protein [unclassified Paraburkholderia]|uniref:YkgJ family cysteine cluster protein n=1 Tax=unclassified Paraburkholderia TaxID=2615204 RepID=UPI002AB282CE|nr:MULTISPECIES: YkgJ family cysteine cluster protein [unclassified Paraburkholderia]
MDSTHFDCTSCGKCCTDLRLPLTFAEATRWIERGGQVDLLCEAIPWPAEPDASNAYAAYKRARTFAAMSGELPVRVGITLAATFSGPCPNLGADLRCGIYTERPLVCRIYPAEINPFYAMKPEFKLCPDEAWQAPTPFAVDGVLMQADTRDAIDASRRADEASVEMKRALCERLGLQHASVANEGFVVASPERERLLAALLDVQQDAREPAAQTVWTLVSNRRATVDTLIEVGARGTMDNDANREGCHYIGL